MAIEKTKSRNVFLKTRDYLDAVGVEMKKVSWPSKEELKESTVVVLTVTGALALFVYGVDYLAGEVLKQFFK